MCSNKSKHCSHKLLSKNRSRIMDGTGESRELKAKTTFLFWRSNQKRDPIITASTLVGPLIKMLWICLSSDWSRILVTVSASKGWNWMFLHKMDLWSLQRHLVIPLLFHVDDGSIFNWRALEPNEYKQQIQPTIAKQAIQNWLLGRRKPD